MGKNVDTKMCIICQTEKTTATTSTEIGRKRIREQSLRRDDVVTKRLKTLGDTNDNWCYHSNNYCYKTYTNEAVVTRLEKRRQSIEIAQQSENPESKSTSSGIKTRSRSSVGRNRPIPTVSLTELRELRCIVCGSYSHMNDFKKVRISEEPLASKLLEATMFFQDEVFNRTCDLEDSDAVIAADCYYHPDCMKAYERS